MEPFKTQTSGINFLEHEGKGLANLQFNFRRTQTTSFGQPQSNKMRRINTFDLFEEPLDFSGFDSSKAKKRPLGFGDSDSFFMSSVPQFQIGRLV